MRDYENNGMYRHSTASALLGWATGKDLRYEQLPVEVQQHPQYGRCLVAVQAIAADEVVLSVPTDRVFASQAAEDLEVHWAAEMGLRLLQERHACRNSSSKGSTNDRSHSCSGGFWGAWIESLPRHAVTPVEFTAAEVQQLVVPSAVQAILNMQACLEDCYAELEPQLQQIDCGWRDFLWAVQADSSGRAAYRLSAAVRYEGLPSSHVSLPGIDMCNHSSTAPNAAVRLLHSPGACQGLAALEEVAPAAAQAACGSYFQLLAGPEGIPAGQQVCISYGNWPAEPFLLLFGFVVCELEHGSTAAGSSSSSRGSGGGAAVVQQQVSDVAVGDEGGSWYEGSAAHAALIQQYCRSKVALARRLAAQYSSSAASAAA
ncbi:hypothetical protein COO60DRAFT_1703728 [Scenedesmus sp. NREL 46B-D3]|nr:hypothetical protein COO60DRAFT_1703728 [Scenedesmus sp. NREL 46B-D3]